MNKSNKNGSLILKAENAMLNHGPTAEVSPRQFFEMTGNGWLSSSEAGKFLSVTPNAVRIMACRGILPAYRMRGRLRFRRVDCLALFKKGA